MPKKKLPTGPNWGVVIVAVIAIMALVAGGVFLLSGRAQAQQSVDTDRPYLAIPVHTGCLQSIICREGPGIWEQPIRTQFRTCGYFRETWAGLSHGGEFMPLLADYLLEHEADLRASLVGSGRLYHLVDVAAATPDARRSFQNEQVLNPRFTGERPSREQLIFALENMGHGQCAITAGGLSFPHAVFGWLWNDGSGHRDAVLEHIDQQAQTGDAEALRLVMLYRQAWRNHAVR